MNLTLVIPLTLPALPAAHAMLSRIAEFDAHRQNDILFVLPASLDPNRCKSIFELAENIFGRGHRTITPFRLPDDTYPYLYNFLFETALHYLTSLPSHTRRPFLWLDPHTLPISRGWLAAIEREYTAAAKPYLGHILTPTTHGTPYPLMSSVGVYPAPPLPKPLMQRLISQRGTAWELSCADLIVPNAAASTHIRTYPFTGQPICWSPTPAPPGYTDISTIPPTATLVHTAQSLGLRAALHGDLLLDHPHPPPTPTTPLTTLPIPSGTFYHSGNLGDLIYALAAIKLAGGGKLIIGPRQLHTSPASSPIRRTAYDQLAPLLDAQPYITSHTFSDRHPGTDNCFDLNTYRTALEDTTLRAKLDLSTIVKAHCYVLGVLERFRHDHSWLTVPRPTPLPFYLINRTSRYHDPSFPWERILKHFAGQLLFIGLPTEHAAFQNTYGPIPYLQVTNHLELASAIAGSLGFIGNQSFPLALALSLNHPIVQEVSPDRPDCTFIRDNILTPPITSNTLSLWSERKPCRSLVLPLPRPPARTSHSTPPVPPSTPTTPNPFYFSGHFDAASGYGTYTLQLVTEIMSRPYEVSLRPITAQEDDGPLPTSIKTRFTRKHRNNPWEFVLYPCVIQPTHITISGKNVIYMTMWESTRIHTPNPNYARAVETLNSCGVVIVPNTWNASVFSSCGIDTPIRIAPLGTDVDAFPLTPNPATDPILTFGTAGRFKGGGIRKGVDTVITAFLQAFPTERNVRLHVKCFPGDPIPNFHDDRIVITAKILSLPELRDWYAATNIFVSGSASEGWGRHQQEAMCMGRPVIGINFGGVCEFFSRENGYAAPWTLEPAEGVYITLGHYAKPTISGLALCMQEAFEDRASILVKSQLASACARQFTISNSLDCIENILREFKFIQ